MNFELVTTKFFRQQFDQLPNEEKKKVAKRLDLIEENPFRNKSLYSKKFGRVFRIRIELEKVEKRIVYVLIKNKVVVAGVTDRGDDYKDLEELLEKVIKELDSYK